MSDLMLILADLSDPEKGTSPALQAHRENGEFRKFTLSYELVRFARGEVSFNSLVEDNLKCNMDIMAHVLKGTVGVLSQGVRNLRMYDVDVRNTVNYGRVNYVDWCESNDALFETYLGASAQGIVLNVSNRVDLKGVHVDGVVSWQGKAEGLVISSRNVCDIGVRVTNLKGSDGEEGVVGDLDKCDDNRCMDDEGNSKDGSCMQA